MKIFGFQINLEVFILIGVIYLILIVHTFSGCCNSGQLLESFVGANTNYGQSSPYKLGDDKPINTSSWYAQDMVVTPGQKYSTGVKNILERQPQPVPLPESEMLMFKNTNFKPECCPSAYSSSTGCACMTTNQYNYLVLRGGNNVPYSEY